MDVTVITPTWDRPKHLALTAAAFARQSHRLEAQHVIVSDGPDPAARAICEEQGYGDPSEDGRLIYAEVGHEGVWGAGCRDAGVRLARGEYCAFWDDDNLYDDHALATLYTAAFGHDIGLVQTVYQGALPSFGGRRFVRIPDRWDGRFAVATVDTMCACVRTEVARRARWADFPGRFHDFYWLEHLRASGASVHFVPVVIGRKL